MGPGFGAAIAKTEATILLVIIAIVFVLGMGTVKGCDYLRSHYSVKVEVEKKP